MGYSVGHENYAQFDPKAVGVNHLEQTSNNEWVTSSGVPFAVYLVLPDRRAPLRRQRNSGLLQRRADPIRPFLPARGQRGPGAWQLAAQWSEFIAGRGDFERGFINPTQYTNWADQLMVGVNWWPVKNTRLSFDWVWTQFNNPIPFTGANPMSGFATFWFRYAMFY